MFNKHLITLSFVTSFLIVSLVSAEEMEKWRWEQNQLNYLQKEMERSFANSLPNPQDIYVGRKFENDVLKSLNTMVSIGTAAGGNPISVIGAVNRVVHNFGPQTGPIEDVTGRVGDVIAIVNVYRTGRDFIRGNFSDASVGAVGLANVGFGKYIDAQKRKLLEPITISEAKQIKFKSDDGFTRLEGTGSVNITKTYTPPKTIRPFGPPDIFEGSTKTITNSQWTNTVRTGNFNNNFSSNNYRLPPIRNYQAPSFNNYSNFKTPTFTAPNFKSNFGTSGFKYSNFGRIR